MFNSTFKEKVQRQWYNGTKFDGDAVQIIENKNKQGNMRIYKVANNVIIHSRNHYLQNE